MTTTTLADMPQSREEMTLAEYIGKHKDIEKALEELRSNGKTILIRGLKSLFLKYPALYRVSWNQYTPYFNDGDPCIFRSNAYYADINEDSLDDECECNEYEGDCEEDCDCECHSRLEIDPDVDGFESDEQKRECIKDVRALLKCFSSDDYLEFFKDHVEVVATRKGIETSFYSHE